LPGKWMIRGVRCSFSCSDGTACCAACRKTNA